jgi:hypothetical protein
MKIHLNFTKLLMLFSPLLLLAVVSFVLFPKNWIDSPAATASVLAIPLIVSGLLWMLGRDKWCLELTGDSLIHHTLGRQEIFHWKDMGPVALGKVSVLGPLGIDVAEFQHRREDLPIVVSAFGNLVGRRILLVFGDDRSEIMVALLEEWRKRQSGTAYVSAATD